MELQALHEEIGKLSVDIKELLAKPELTSDEEARYAAMDAERDKKMAQRDRIIKQEAVEKRLAESERRTEPSQPGQQTRTAPRPAVRVTGATWFEGVRAWLLAGSDVDRTPEMRDAASRAGFNLDQKQIHISLPANSLRSRHQDDMKDWEQRAQGIATGGAGAFTVPDEMMRELEISLLAFGGMRNVATVIRTDTGAALPFPTVNDTGNVGVILAENTAAAEQDVTFAQMVLDAYKYSSKLVRVSVELLQDSSINVAQFLGRALGERIGRITNTHFTTGTGSSQPNGIVTASGVGKTGATGQTTSVIYDDLVDLLHSVDPAYREGARWMFHDSTLKALKKIKIPQFSGDTAGQPLWQPGIAFREPDTILGYPYTINQDVPVMAANAKSILFGALNKYMIRDVRDVTLIRLDERYAELHQVGFLAFSRHDGDLHDAGTDPVKHYANSAT